MNALLLPLRPSTYDLTLSTLRRAAILALSTLLGGHALLSCGGSNTNSTSPAPVPTPTPTPTFFFRVNLVQIASNPDDHDVGYQIGDHIFFYVRWDGRFELAGQPQLKIQVGSRLVNALLNGWDTNENPNYTYGGSTTLSFFYVVTDDDYDPDGISVLGLEMNGASMTPLSEGFSVDVDLRRHAIQNNPAHRVRAANPVHRVSGLYVTSVPNDTRIGYQEGDRIWFGVRWAGEIEVDGWPRLGFEMGEEQRYASYWDQREDSVTFVYTVTFYDHDPNGISVREGAIELNDGVISAVDGGADVDTDMSRYSIDNARLHRVRPDAPQSDVRRCTVERREVRRHPAGFVLDEWNGEPFRVDIVRNFPPFVTDADLEELLEPIGVAADAIEDQLGYRILEKGGIVPVPSGMRPGWNKDYHRYDENPLPREPRQLLAFYMDDDSSFWDHRGGSPNVAFTYTGTTSYNKRTMGPWWHDRDSCCIGRYSGNGRMGHVLIHEVAHLLGFEHPDVPFGTPGVRMAWGSLAAPWLSGSSVHFWAERDIEVLRCIFPRR